MITHLKNEGLIRLSNFKYIYFVILVNKPYLIVSSLICQTKYLNGLDISMQSVKDH